MRSIPESEARYLLSLPKRCEDAPEWAPMKVQPDTFEIGVGVVGQDGKRVGLYVQLEYRYSRKTNITKYKFSLFDRQPYGLDRVYQLQVNHFFKPIADLHQRSHEHIGDLRELGDASWANWRYDDVITYFCKQTNLIFDPPIPHPEEFKLKG